MQAHERAVPRVPGVGGRVQFEREHRGAMLPETRGWRAEMFEQAALDVVGLSNERDGASGV